MPVSLVFEDVFFAELKDGDEFLSMIAHTDGQMKQTLCRKVRPWLTATGWSNASIIDPDWIDFNKCFVEFEDMEIVRRYGVRS